jgi:GTP-binding protein Era
MIIGKGASKIKEIGSMARIDIEKMLDKKVNLKLFVKTKENWRDSEFLLKNFGFISEDKDE